MSIDWRYPPRAHDPSLRLHHHGRLQPMPIERTASSRQRLTVGSTLLVAVLLVVGIAQAF